MATDIKSIQETADALLELGMAKGASFQEAYLASHGRYAQCIQTPQVIPKDDQKLPMDKTLRPHYQIESWSALGFALPVVSPVSVRIDTYSGPKGHDWAATATFIADEVRYAKTIAANGTEAQTTDWVSSSLKDKLFPVVDGGAAEVEISLP